MNEDQDFFQYYSDWKQASDYCTKYIGLTILKALMDYSGFPYKYGEMIRRLVSLPQPATEEYFDNGYKVRKTKWKGFIRDGFMMGNPLTKVI